MLFTYKKCIQAACPSFPPQVDGSVLAVFICHRNICGQRLLSRGQRMAACRRRDLNLWLKTRLLPSLPPFSFGPSINLLPSDGKSLISTSEYWNTPAALDLYHHETTGKVWTSLCVHSRSVSACLSVTFLEMLIS
jgi:hypothetical protein